ncbi:MAG: hypothetical protein ACRDZX_07745, partial [Acidimicrobiales bacterium]
SHMYSKPLQLDLIKGKPEIDSRRDVNKAALSRYPLLEYIVKKVLPISAIRPSLAVYPQVSTDIQSLAQNLATGMSVNKAVGAYVKTLNTLVGAAHVSGS